MATSGSSDFNRTGNEIIRAAARKINAVRAGSVMGADAIADWREALNAMVKHWQVTEELHIWTVAEAVLITQADTIQYALSNASTSAHCCLASDFVETEISADEASGQTTLSVDDTDDIAVSDKIAIQQDDGSIHFSTVSSKTSSTVTIASALTDSAASGKLVFCYTNRIVRPLRIVDARSYDPSSGNSTPLTVIARKQYQDITNKTLAGRANQFFYDRQLTTGQLYIWQAEESVANLIKFTWHRPIEDFDAAGDNPDLPPEWIQTLIFNLALVMAPEYSVPAEKFNQIATMAATYLDDMKGLDRETEPVQFGVDMEC